MLRFAATVTTHTKSNFLQGGVDRQDALRAYRQGDGIMVTLDEYPRAARNVSLSYRSIAPLVGTPMELEVWRLGTGKPQVDFRAALGGDNTRTLDNRALVIARFFAELRGDVAQIEH